MLMNESYRKYLISCNQIIELARFDDSNVHIKAIRSIRKHITFGNQLNFTISKSQISSMPKVHTIVYVIYHKMWPDRSEHAYNLSNVWSTFL